MVMRQYLGEAESVAWGDEWWGIEDVEENEWRGSGQSEEVRWWSEGGRLQDEEKKEEEEEEEA